MVLPCKKLQMARALGRLPASVTKQPSELVVADQEGAQHLMPQLRRQVGILGGNADYSGGRLGHQAFAQDAVGLW